MATLDAANARDHEVVVENPRHAKQLSPTSTPPKVLDAASPSERSIDRGSFRPSTGEYGRVVARSDSNGSTQGSSSTEPRLSSSSPTVITRRSTTPSLSSPQKPAKVVPVLDATTHVSNDAQPRLCLLGATPVDERSLSPAYTMRLPPIEEGTEPTCPGEPKADIVPEVLAKTLQSPDDKSETAGQSTSAADDNEEANDGAVDATPPRNSSGKSSKVKTPSKTPIQRRTTKPTETKAKALRLTPVSTLTGPGRREQLKPTLNDNALTKDQRIPTAVGRMDVAPPNASLYPNKSVYDASSDRKLLIGCRVHSTGDIFTARSKSTAVLLKSASEEASWRTRLAILGGNCTDDKVSNSSSYYEADFDENALLGHGSLKWRKEELSPPIEPLSGHSAVSLTGIDSDKFIIFGGSSSASLFSSIYVVDASTKLTYASSTMGQQPASRTEHTCCLINSILYVFGGRVLKSAQKTPTAMSINRNGVATPRPPPSGGISPSAMSPNNSIPSQHWHLLQPCKVFRDLWKLDLRDFEWVRVPLQPESLQALSMNGGGAPVPPDSFKPAENEERVPRGRAGHTAVAWNGASYIFGGFDGETVLEDIWRLSASEKWRQCVPRGRQPGRRYGSASAISGDLWLIHGGLSENAVVLNDFVVIDLITWSCCRVRVDVHRNPARLLPSLAFHTAVCVPLRVLNSVSTGETPAAVVLVGGYGKSGTKSNAIYTVIPSKLAVDAVVETPHYRELLDHFLPPVEVATPTKLTSDARHLIATKPKDVAPIAEKICTDTDPAAAAAQDVATTTTTTTTIAKGESSTTVVAPSAPTRDGVECCGTTCLENAKLVEELRLQNAYLGERLSEQKSENLVLRGASRRMAWLQQMLEETEKELEVYRAMRRHPLLGCVLHGCLEAFEADQTRRQQRRHQVATVVADQTFPASQSQQKDPSQRQSSSYDALLKPASPCDSGTPNVFQRSVSDV